MDKFKSQTLFNSVDYVTGLKQSQGKTKDERVKKNSLLTHVNPGLLYSGPILTF